MPERSVRIFPRRDQARSSEGMKARKYRSTHGVTYASRANATAPTWRTRCGRRELDAPIGSAAGSRLASFVTIIKSMFCGPRESPTIYCTNLRDECSISLSEIGIGSRARVRSSRLICEIQRMTSARARDSYQSSAATDLYTGLSIRGAANVARISRATVHSYESG